MATVTLFESLDQFVAPGQTREFTQGSPFVVSGFYDAISIAISTPPATPPSFARVTLVSTAVERDVGGNLRRRYTVRNESGPNVGVSFRRTTVQISP